LRDAYLTLPSLKVLILIEPNSPSVIVHRRSSEGNFAAESYFGLDATIPLPEIEASLSLSEIYERVDFVG
jgi:Uma2 family endonuclease